MDRPPLAKFPACQLWERITPDGSRLLSGRWGDVRLLIVPNPVRADATSASHLLMLGEPIPESPKPKKEHVP